MRSVTQDEWAEALCQIPCYATEYNGRGHSVMYHHTTAIGSPSVVVGEVHYCANGDKFYFVEETLCS